MDWTAIPSLAADFIQAASGYTQDTAINVWTGLTEPGAMTFTQRAFQILKLIGSTGCLVACVLTDEPIGLAGSLLADGEVVMDFEKAGKRHRLTHPPPTQKPS